MTYSRVLGTIGLIGATVLGAMGPVHVSQAALTSDRTPPSTKLSPAAAKAAALQALRVGYMTTRNGKRVYLSSALVNNFRGLGGAKASGAHSAGHADSSPPPSVGGGQRANQDFGFYLTGNGQLFHNTESVAVDPVSPIHLSISATDTRLGSDGSIFNTSSDTIFQQTFNPTCFSPARVPTPCSLIEALGGPGVYNSTQGVTLANSFSDLVIPDMVSGAVPDAINTAACPVALTAAQVAAIPAAGLNGAFTSTSAPVGTCATVPVGVTAVQATVACIPASGAFTSPAVLLNSPGFSNGCVPYDSAGDQSVAFDTVGDLYVVSLGLVSIDPLPRAEPFTDAPQTDVVLNVSPAIQPVGAPAGVSLTNQPNAAGRVFNNLAPDSTVAACDPTQSSTFTCMHNEVIASSASSNFLTPSVDDGAASPALVVGRNWQADDAAGTGFGLCDATQTFDGVTFGPDFCLIDTPYIVVNGVVDPTAYVTYTVYDFSLLTSNIFLTTALVPGPGAGALPVWTPPIMVDNPNGEEGPDVNTFCNNGATNFCLDSWGAEPTVGPDGTVYIAYENADVPGGDTVNCAPAYCNQVLVASAFQPSFTSPIATIANESFVSEVMDHDAFESSVTTDPLVAADPAGLDPDGGAYFTIPNRPTIAVSAPVTLNGITYSGGVLAVVWTDQRSCTGAPCTIRLNGGTRIWYSLGAAKSGRILSFNLLGTLGASGTISPPTVQTPAVASVIKEVYEPNVVANQFFPWVTASQFVGSTIPDNIFVGFYQEVPATVTTFPSTTATAPALVFYVAKSSDYGATFGVNPATTAMPLPTTPLGAGYCSVFGFTAAAFPATNAAGGTQQLAACNAVPYFGTYTGIAWDKSNGAYVSWTDTRPNNKNFMVAGSQDVYAAHVS